MSPENAPEILYVEDDRLTAKRVLTSLAETGFIITHASSGREALKAFEETDFDLVALDLVLPDMDGKDIIRKMKDMKPLPPIVVITGFGDETTVVEVMRLGATDYIPKDTDGRYIILLPTVFEIAIYQGRMARLKRSIEDELHFSRENFRNLLNATTDFIFVIDDDGNLLNFNPALQTSLGYTGEELRSMTIFDLHPANLREEMMETMSRMVDGELDSCDVPMMRKSGDLLDIETRISKGRWGEREVLYVITRDMSIQRRTDQALRDSQRMLELVINNIPEHIFWKDANLRYLGCNENYARASGAENPAQLIGKSDEELSPILPISLCCKEEQRKVIETGEPQLHATVQIRDHDGKQLAFDVNRIPLRDSGENIIGLLITREDISERKEMENQLREREQLLSVVTTNMHDMVALVDPDFRYKYVSPSHLDVMGFSPEELLGQSPLGLIYNEDNRAVQLAIAEGFGTKKPQRVEFRLKHRDGHQIWMECIGVPIFDETGEIESIVLASRDISERKEFEARLLEKKQALEESNEELDAFSHTVAHDLKNPLNSILGLSNLLRENIELSVDEISDSLKFIEQSATNMNGIIDSLMVLAGVRKEDITLEKVDMAEIVEHTLGRLTFYMHDMNANISIGELPSSCGYGPWIQEVWVNYITNAVKYGGSPPVIQIGGDVLDDGRVKYWVKDNGPGISKADQQRLFVPFSRLRQVSVKGYGLGLSIVTRIVDRLGGEVGIESEVGQGSKFYFILPGVNSNAAGADGTVRTAE